MKSRTDERGQATVETMLFLPILILFLLFLLDLGRYIMAWTSVEQASAQVATMAYEQISGPDAFHMAQSAAHQAAPNLDSSKLKVTMEKGHLSDSTYSHKLYNEGTGTYDSRTSVVCTLPVTFTITYDDTWLTFIGGAISAAQGDGGSVFTIAITKTREYDVTMEGGKW